jgi:phage virion morphogenesis protein
MAGASFQVSLNDDARATINALLLQSLHLPMKEIGAALLTSTQQRFENEESPEGDPWKDLAISTQLRRTSKTSIRGNEHKLRDKGLLYASLTYIASDFEVAVGSNRKYAAIQQFGGTDDMPPGPAGVPARPYLGLSSDDEIEVGDILIEHLGRAL